MVLYNFDTIHRCLQNRTPRYLTDYCVHASEVPGRQHLRSARRRDVFVTALYKLTLLTYSIQTLLQTIMLGPRSACDDRTDRQADTDRLTEFPCQYLNQTVGLACCRTITMTPFTYVMLDIELQSAYNFAVKRFTRKGRNPLGELVGNYLPTRVDKPRFPTSFPTSSPSGLRP